MMKASRYAGTGGRIVAVLGAVVALTAGGIARAADLAGVWYAEGAGVSGEVRLPGTLADVRLGKRWSYEDYVRFAKSVDRSPQKGALVREYQTLGKVRYSRRITLTAADCAAPAELVLERVMWQSEAFWDGQSLGTRDSLATPHVFTVPQNLLTPGEHRLDLDIDNSPRYQFSCYAHSYGPVMQSVWHGVTGRLELRARQPLAGVRVFAEWPAALRLELPEGVTLAADGIRLDGAPLAVAGTTDSPFVKDRRILAIRLPEGIRPWSEHDPRLYTLTLADEAGRSFTRRIGFRTVVSDKPGHAIRLNGTRIFLRATLECCNFARTGSPFMTRAEWIEVMRRLKDEDGLNALRFHSWTPPEAAFEAADEVGLYLLPEADLWADGWMGRQVWAAGQGTPLDGFLKREMDDILAAYGDHPSFLSLAIGNELGTAEFRVAGGWMNELRVRDPRHLYFVSTARRIAPGDDYMVTHNIPNAGRCRMRLKANSDWEYEDVYSRAPLPVASHEIGQWPVYPLWTELAKYDGVMRPYNLELCRNRAEANATMRFNARYHAASALLNRLMYRDEIESFLRTSACAGVELLGVVDFTGQGEALVGWRDPFYDLKPGARMTPPFARVWGPTNYLMRTAKYVWTAGETFRAKLLVRNLTTDVWPKGMRIPYSIEPGVRCGEVALAKDVGAGELAEVGCVSLPIGADLLPAGGASRRYTLRFGTNEWNFWAFPKEDVAPVPAGVRLTADWSVARAALEKGETVVYTGSSRHATKGNFRPVYWSADWFPNPNPLGATLGTWFDVNSELLAGFATDCWTDWQWYDLANGATIYDLSDLPRTVTPVALSVNDFHFSIFSGSLLHLAVGERGGELVACGYDLGGGTVASRRLRASIFAALSKPGRKSPRDRVDLVTLTRVFAPKPAPSPVHVTPPAEYAGCALYIETANGLRKRGVNLPWNRAKDAAFLEKGVAYRFGGSREHGIWRDGDGAFWHGRRMDVTITCTTPMNGTLLVRLRDPNGLGRTGRGDLEGRKFTVPRHDRTTNPRGELWLRLPVIREDFLDGRIELKLQAEKGPNLMIDRLALLPDK